MLKASSQLLLPISIVYLSQTRTGRCCFGEKKNALLYYKDCIAKYDELADTEYEKLVESRLNWRDASVVRPPSSGGRSSFSEMYFTVLPDTVREALGIKAPDLQSGTAVVEFKSIAAKQSGTCTACHMSMSFSDDKVMSQLIFILNSCSMQSLRRTVLVYYEGCTGSS